MPTEAPAAGAPPVHRASTSAPISLQAINGWRGPGALAVVFGHFSVTTGAMRFADLLPLSLVVDLFFVLSGLLIAHAYTQKLRHAAAIPEYILRRFARIWPVHLAMLALLVAFEFAKVPATHFGAHFAAQPFAADGVNPASAVWSNLLLVHSLGLHHSGTWNYPSWSLSVEFITYAAFAAFCLLRPAARRTASVAIIVLSLAVLAFVAPKHMHSTYDYGLFRCTAGFFAGSLLHDLLRNVRLPSWPLPTVVECLAFGLVAVWIGRYSGTVLAFAAPVVFCLFVLAFIPGHGLLSKLLSTKPFQFMAELSFAIYMVHAVMLIILMAALRMVERASGIPLFVTVPDPHPLAGTPATMLQLLAPQNLATTTAIALVYLACVLIASYATYRFIEIPGRAVFGALARRPAAMPLDLPAAPSGT